MAYFVHDNFPFFPFSSFPNYYQFILNLILASLILFQRVALIVLLSYI